MNSFIELNNMPQNQVEYIARQIVAGVLYGMKGANLEKGITNVEEDKPLQKEGTAMAKFRTRVQIGKNDDGTPIYKQIQADGQNELNDRIVQVYIESGRIWKFMDHPETDLPKPKITFKEYADKWLDVYKLGKLKPSTIATYRKHLCAHVLPAFGNREIASITTEDIQLFLNERKHLAKKTLSSMRHFMGEVFKDAVEDGLIAKDPTSSRRISIPSTKTNERDALPLEQFREIVSNLDNLSMPDKQFLVLVMFTGIRRGEVLGLRWEDIDTEAGLIHVRRNVTHAGGNRPVIGTPKTKSGKRDIPLDPFVLEVLEPIQESGFIIGGESPITMTTYNNTMKRIRKAVDLHGATAHVFRHSYLTYMAGEATDLKTLQAIAGHSTIGMTMNRYVHAQPEKIKEAGKRMHDLLAG